MASTRWIIVPPSNLLNGDAVGPVAEKDLNDVAARMLIAAVAEEGSEFFPDFDPFGGAAVTNLIGMDFRIVPLVSAKAAL